MADVEYAIVGGGVIGRALALALTNRTTSGDVVVIERCAKDRVENQSTRNSGVIHAGIYYRRAERPIKARLCVEGNARLYEFCEEHGVAHAKTGKLVVATNAQEEDYLQGVLSIALQNEVPGVREIGADEAKEMEPNLRVTPAIYAPTSGVIDSAGYLAALRRAGTSHNLFATEVTSISWNGTDFEVATTSGGRVERFTAKYLLNAAGSHADRIATLLRPDCDFLLVPARGEAAKFYQSRRPELVLGGRNIYPAPSGYYADGRRANVSFAEFQRLLETGEVTETVGVHLTPTLSADGSLASTMTIGPAIRAGVAKDDLRHDLYPTNHFHRSVSDFFPGLREDDVELHQAGIQARMAGQLDWHIARDSAYSRCLHCVGIDSPGMTASLAIADYALDQLHGEGSGELR